MQVLPLLPPRLLLICRRACEPAFVSLLLLPQIYSERKGKHTQPPVSLRCCLLGCTVHLALASADRRARCAAFFAGILIPGQGPAVVA